MYISVVIPLYNKAETIPRAMQSVIRQLTPDVELIVVDDGSTDGSLEIAETVMQAHPDTCVRVHTQANGGVSAARNSGIGLARGEFVALLDADDCYDAHFLSEIRALIDKFPGAAGFCTSYRFCESASGHCRDASIVGLSGSGQPQLLADFFRSTATGDLPVTSSSVCIKKSALLALGGFPDKENMGEDQAVWSQLALQHSIAISPRVSATYFEAATNSLMQSVSPAAEMPYSKRLQQQLDRRQIPVELRQSVKRYITIHLFDLVRRNLQAGNRDHARNLLQDPRTRADLKRWFYWHSRLLLKSAGRRRC